MPAVKLTKNELKRQKDALKRYRRYLPTLVLKKQQLQMVIRQLEGRLAEETRKRKEMLDGAATWLEIFSRAVPLPGLAAGQERGNRNRQHRRRGDPDLQVHGFHHGRATTCSATPPWVDDALALFAALARLDVEIGLLRRQVELLAAELRVTSQRVNLFEKVKIPEAIESIRRIQIFLGDQQTAAVVTGKTAKRNLLRREEAS